MHILKKTEQVFSMYANIFDVDFFTWNKRFYYKIDVKRVYLLDLFSLTISLVKKVIDKDIVIALGFPALWESLILLIFSKIRKIPIFIRDTHWYWPQTKISKLLWPFYFRILKYVNGILCPGWASYKYWKSYSFKNVYIVHFYALESYMTECNYNRQKMRQKLGIDNDEILFLYLGRLIKKKGVDKIIMTLYKIVKENPEYKVKLLIAGDGPERKNLENLCEQLGITNRVIFLGSIPERLKKCIYQAADIFVYTPIIERIPEEWGVAPLEALSLGMPTIISTAVGSLPDISGAVLVVKWVDGEDLYRAMKKVIEDEQLRNYLSKRAIAVYRKLASETNVKLELLKAILYALKEHRY